MPESARPSLDLFDEVYPERLPERLHWLEEHFGISHARMLRLMGFAPDAAISESTCDWPELVRQHEPLADRLEHLLTHYLSFFDYDAEQAGKEFARDFTRKAAAGNRDLLGSIPALASAKTPAEHEAVLLEAAQQEGPGLLPAMALLIGSPSQPPDENGTAAHPRKRQSSS